MQLQALGLKQQPKELQSLMQPLQRSVINNPHNFPFTDMRNSPPITPLTSLRNKCHKISSIFLAFVLILYLLICYVFQLLFDLVMEKFSSEPWFEPKPSRTEPEVQFRVLKIYKKCEPPWTCSNSFEPLKVQAWSTQNSCDIVWLELLFL